MHASIVQRSHLVLFRLGVAVANVETNTTEWGSLILAAYLHKNMAFTKDRRMDTVTPGSRWVHRGAVLLFSPTIHLVNRTDTGRSCSALVGRSRRSQGGWPALQQCCPGGPVAGDGSGPCNPPAHRDALLVPMLPSAQSGVRGPPPPPSTPPTPHSNLNCY